MSIRSFGLIAEEKTGTFCRKIKKSVLESEAWSQAGKLRPYQWGIIGLCLIICYGVKIFTYSFGIDTESFAFRYDAAMIEFVQSGRYSIFFFKKVFGIKPFVPQFSIALWIVSFAVYGIIGGLFASLFTKRKSGWYTVLFSALLFSHPVFAEQFYFTHQAFEITLGMIGSLISAYLACFWCEQYKKTWAFVLSLLIAVVSFGCYQAVPALYIAEFFCYMYGFLSADRISNKWKFLLRAGAIMLLSAILYFGTDKIAHLLIHAENSYVGGMFGWKLSDPMPTIRMIAANLRMVITAQGPFYNLFYPVIAAVFLVLNLIALIRGKEERGAHGWKLFTAAVIAFSPFFLMIFTGHAMIVRTQFVLPFVCAYMGVVSIDMVSTELEGVKKLAGRILLIALATAAVFIQSQTINRLWNTAYITYQNDLLFANNLIHTIEEATGESLVHTDKKILFTGRYVPHKAANTLVGETIGKSFFEYDNHLEYMGSTYRIVGFYENIGYELWSASLEQAIEGQAIARTMPAYPKEGCVRVQDNLIIVKLSE